jgi:hypothetical protein
MTVCSGFDILVSNTRDKCVIWLKEHVSGLQRRWYNKERVGRIALYASIAPVYQILNKRSRRA